VSIAIMSTYANGRSILHKGHGKTQLATAPDVCKTPSPGGPVPVPYPNMSPDSNLTKGAATVKINGNPVANTGSQLSRSNGDEPGTAGGIISSKNMGAFGWPAGSLDVNAEGKSVVRLLDANLTNGNAYNTTGLDLGETGLGYGDDIECPRMDCDLDRDMEQHRIEETIDVAIMCAAFSQECVDKAPKIMNSKRTVGKMVGVAICKCNTVWKAISGAPIKDKNVVKTFGSTFHNTVGDRPRDLFFTLIQAVNPGWQCAALKILSNAGSHKIVAMSEKWVGRHDDNGQRIAKTYSVQNITFPIAMWDGTLRESKTKRADQVRGGPEGPLPSGSSIPSCGKCQTFLPALICKNKPC
jgi:uncharacterized Zn-binding protein involved in type VI secretion